VNGLALTRSARVSGVAGKILLTAFFSLVFFGSAIARQQSAINSNNSAPHTGQIAGHIYSAVTGQPLAKAVVALEFQSDEANPPSIETGSDGAFVFTSLAPGKYAVSVERCGYIDGTFEDNDFKSLISLDRGQKREGIDIRLERGGAISGSITDADNEPVPGLLIEAKSFPYQPGGELGGGGVASSARTDDLGNFRLIGLNPGSYFIDVANPAVEIASAGAVQYREVYYPEAYSLHDAQRVRVNAGTETSGIHVPVRLERAFGVRGRVYPDCRREGCAVSTEVFSTLPTRSASNNSTSGDGSFLLGGLFPGSYSIKASGFRQSGGLPREYFGTGSVRVQVVDRDADADVSLGPLAEISGAVVDEPTKLAALKSVQIVVTRVALMDGEIPNDRSDNSDSSTSESLDVAGRFLMTKIDPGTYVFGLTREQQIRFIVGSIESNPAAAAENIGLMYLKEVNCGGRDYAKQVFELSGGARLSDCKITIGRDTASINGRVMDGDKGMGGRLVVAIPESPELRRNPRYTLSGRTNHDGQFGIEGIIPGDYLIFTVTPNEERSYYALDFAERNASVAERATFKPGETKTFVLRPSAAQ
jgi:protocatechuate 3,4-dioxygenase beta subunit